MSLLVTPIFPSSERKKEEEPDMQARRLIDSKVRGFVLERIAHTKGGLLPSASAPENIIDLLPEFELVKGGRALKEKKKAKYRKTPRARGAPIGLLPVDPEGWLNALMQFILFLPGFSDSFHFAPRSFYPMQEYIDKYHHDQQEGSLVSSANGAALLRFLSMRFPGFCLYEIFCCLLSLLHPKWAVHRDIADALKAEQGDLFVTQSLSKRQIFAGPILYDLDAFIEMRPDGLGMNYVAYVKTDGCWYQCDDERITQMRSDSLALPLQKGILFHYKQIIVGNGARLK
jgi:hypothetical protein